jgi:hypothetical protein
LDDCASQTGGRDRTNDTRWKNHSYSSGTDPIGQAIWEMPSGQIDDHNTDPENIKDRWRCENSEKKPVTSWRQMASLFR